MLLKLNNCNFQTTRYGVHYNYTIDHLSISLCRYQKVQKRNSCVVQLVDGTFGEIKYFFVDKTGRVMAVIMPFISQGPSFSCKRLEQFIYPVTKVDGVILREVKDISRKCVLVQIDTHIFM